MEFVSAWASSSIWIGVRRTIQALNNDTFCSIGLGNSIYFWKDNWLGYRLSDKLRIPDYMLPFFDQKISDYYYDGVWHLTSNFVQAFPTIALDIVTTPIVAEKDDKAWVHSSFGEVTAALAFDHIRPSFPEVDWGRWIWAPFIPTRRSLFVWRAIMGRLPTFDVLRRQGFAGPNRCPLCGCHEETIDHILWSCPFSTHIWYDFLQWFNLEPPLYLDVGSLLRFAMGFHAGKQVINLWRIGFISLLWGLWFHRNAVIYNDVKPSCMAVLSQAKVFLHEASSNFDLGPMNNTISDLVILRKLSITGKPRKPPTHLYVSWQLPPPSWVKINTDGSIRDGIMHAGGVIRNAFNEVLGCYHFSGGRGAAFEAELFSLIIAMEFAHRLGWSYVWFEADSSFVVNLLASRSNMVPWRFKPRWQQALRYMASISFRITHIYREGNRVADFLASTVREEGYWPHAIYSIVNFVHEDLHVPFFTRVVD